MFKTVKRVIVLALYLFLSIGAGQELEIGFIGGLLVVALIGGVLCLFFMALNNVFRCVNRGSGKGEG